MENRICWLEVIDRLLTPAQAEIWVRATVDPVTPVMDLRGRLMGPRCPYADTVEVAYPLRPLARPEDATGGRNTLVRRVVIPEPSFWEPESPFLYEGPMELWQDSERREVRVLRHGLCQVQLGTRGLLVNGRPLLLRGRRVDPSRYDSDLLALRRTGCNLLLAPMGQDFAELLERADRLGFFVVGVLNERTLEMVFLEGVDWVDVPPSFFGWVISHPDWATACSFARASRFLPLYRRFGAMVSEPLPAEVPREISFLIGPAGAASAVGLPWLLDGPAEELPAGCIGGILPG
jgi:hypothetical protein